MQLVTNLFSYLVYFATIWVAVFFMCLPLWKPLPPKKIGRGHADSAPERPYIGRKFLLSLAITAVLMLTFIGLQHVGILPHLNDFDK